MLSLSGYHFSTTDYEINSVTVVDESGNTICTLTPIDTATHDYECPVTLAQTSGWEDKLKGGYKLRATTVAYKTKGTLTVDNPTPLAGVYAGPPALTAGLCLPNID